MAGRTDTLRRVQGLIDSADSYESVGNFEAAATYRAKAEQLMVDYAIESFELAAAADAKDASIREEPEVRTISFEGVPYAVRQPLGDMFWQLVRHCRCVHSEYGHKSRAVIGYPADLDYLEMLYTSLRMDLSGKLVPHAVPGDLNASIAALKLAGRDWQGVFAALRDDFPGAFPDGHIPCDAHEMPYMWQRKERDYKGSLKDCDACQANEWAAKLPYGGTVRLSKRYAAHCKRAGVPQVKDAPQVWARSFVDGYTERISERLRELAEGVSVSTAGGLVLAGRAEALKEFEFQLHPERRPHPAGCDCDPCHLRRCKTRATCTRTVCERARKPVRRTRTTYRYVMTSGAAERAGRAAANTADLTGRGRRVGATVRGEIG
jgi:hypothetical protein